jgi:hypothetical protein
MIFRAFKWGFGFRLGTMTARAVARLALLALFAVLFVIATASAAGRQVYLEGEDDLGNGYKHCIYSEGVVITIPSHRLCPLSIEV